VGVMNLAGMMSWSRQPLRKCNRKFEASSMVENGFAGMTAWLEGYGSGRRRALWQ